MEQLPIDLPPARNDRAEDFIVFEGNRVAWQWLHKVADWPNHAAILTGPSASGKTHLARIWAERTGAAFYNGVELTAGRDPQLLATSGALVVDAVEQCNQDTLFHLVNHVRATAGASLLLTMNGATPWQYFSLPDVRSRLQALPQVALDSPDDEALAALLVKSFNDRQLRVGDDTIRYLLPRIERSYAAVLDLVNQLDMAALRSRKPITPAMARQLLTEI